MKRLLPVLVLFAATVGCDFDEAFRRYCAGNPQCPRQDAGPDLASRPDLASNPDTAGTPDVPATPDTADLPDLPGEPDLPDEPDLPSWPDGPDWPDLAGKPPREAGAGDRTPPMVPRSCATPSDCGPNEICHSASKVCMSTCTTRADCPDYLDTCAEIRGERGLRVCICTNNRSCAGLGLICHLLDNLCEPQCSSSEDYCSTFQPQRVCDPSGMCQLPCTGNWDCPSPIQPRCDQTSQLCSGCAYVSDCSGRPDGLTQCAANGACVRPPP